MIAPEERAFEEAAGRLREEAKRQRGNAVHIFKGFRKIEEHRLRLWHRSGGGGREVVRARSDMVDVLCRELFVTVVNEVGVGGVGEEMVLAAFGGYGRRELTPMSDVDIIFLHARETLSEAAREVVRIYLMSLWDIGFKVGHATRSVRVAIRHANEDLLSKTALLESRYLCGNRELFSHFRERFEAECVRGKEGEYLEWRLRNQRENHLKSGDTVFVQEPNVKSGVGGLRDYQNLLWCGYFRCGATSGAKLVEKKVLRERERELIEQGYDFLLRVRTEMQYLEDRAVDVLNLQLQGKVAAALGYGQRNILRKVEAFMRDYFSHTRAIQLQTQAGLERMGLVPERKPSGIFGIWRRPKVEKFDGFVAREGILYLESREAIQEDEFRLIRAFLHAQVRGLELSGELRDTIRRKLPLVNRTFQYARASRETFLAILARKGEVGRILREMHDLGFLGRYLPEFGALTCLVQHEFFHRYTADEHTLVCVEKLDSLLLTEEERFVGYRDIFQKLEDPAILYLAILLHDTGKALNTRSHEDASAELAQKVARRLQLSAARRRMLITLVNLHFELSLTAQKRDLDDPATIEAFAGHFHSRAELDGLMLLTLADGMGTNERNWSDWKESLVWTLYRKTADYLEHGAVVLELAERRRWELRESVCKLLPKDCGDEVEAHFELMPARYFGMFDAEVVAEHLKLFREFFAKQIREEGSGLMPACRWIMRPEKGHTEFWLCGWDRERLLERVAGALLSCNMNVLSSDIFTRSDNLALDIFRVVGADRGPVCSEREMAKVESRIEASLMNEEFDFRPLLKGDNRLKFYKISSEAELPTKIFISNDQHPKYTLVDIQTPDWQGLFYELLRAFGRAGVNIELSRITTERDVAFDSFYVTARGGGKLSGAMVSRLQALLKQACSRPAGLS